MTLTHLLRIQIPVILQRLHTTKEDLDWMRKQIESSEIIIKESVLNAFAGLQLMFSPSTVFSLEHLKKVFNPPHWDRNDCKLELKACLNNVDRRRH